MAGIVKDLLGSTIRHEMKRRVDEVLKAGGEWSETARALIEAMNRLSIAIEKGDVDRSNLKSISKSVKHLSKRTTRLAKAFESHHKTLEKIRAQVEEL